MAGVDVSYFLFLLSFVPSTRCSQPWQGDSSITIDRFDGRAHLDMIADYKASGDVDEEPGGMSSREKRELAYERYRILIQNDFLKSEFIGFKMRTQFGGHVLHWLLHQRNGLVTFGTFSVPEEKFLKTIELEELYGGKTYQAKQSKEDKKKAKASGTKAAIGFVYEDSTGPTVGAPSEESGRPVPKNLKSTPAGGPNFQEPAKTKEGEGEDDSDGEELDLDISVDIMALSNDARKEINLVGKGYNLGKEDFIKYLGRDIEEQEEAKVSRQQEEEKALLTVRNRE